MPIRSKTLDVVMGWVRPLQFRGKPRLFESWAHKQGIRRATVFGAPMLLDTSNYIDRMIWTGCFEPINVHRFRYILSRGATVIDVGANIGFFSALSASIVGPHGRVHAIEPHPDNVRILRDAVGSIPQITVRDFALDEVEGTGHVAQADQALFANRTATMVNGKDLGGHEVATRTLDGFISETGPVDLVKIGVDGYEMRILRGAEQSMRAGLIKNVTVEIVTQWFETSGETLAELDQLMARCGMVDVSHETALASFLLGGTADRHYRFGG
jgi:FkbM family methyltransferase